MSNEETYQVRLVREVAEEIDPEIEVYTGGSVRGKDASGIVVAVTAPVCRPVDGGEGSAPSGLKCSFFLPAPAMCEEVQ